MVELMFKMVFWLLAAMALGFVMAWFLAKIFYQKKQRLEVDTLSAVLLERNNMIDKLEQKFRNEKIMFEKVSDNFKNTEEALAQKSSLLTTLQNKLNNLNVYEQESIELKRQNLLLSKEVKQLKVADKERVRELEDFEEVLILAEKKVDENEQNYQQVLKSLDERVEALEEERQNYINTIKRYEKDMAELEEALQLYTSTTSDPEFVISKDQFVKIEDQLKMYQEQLLLLENENNELRLKIEKSEKTPEKLLEENTVKEVKKERDEGSMVKVFRETYKKITKS